MGEIAPAFPRPVPGGLSGGHVNVNGGTLGCLVSVNGAGRFILSNNHVLANVNAATPGDPILEPGLAAGGAANEPIARLTAFSKIHLNNPIRNEIDAATAELLHPADMTSDIQGIGPVQSTTLAAVHGMTVRKHGAITQHTIGVVDDETADFRTTFPGAGFAYFHNQFGIISTDTGPFADRGDTGALVVEATTLQPVGLLFAVSPPVTFCNRIDAVLSAFGAQIL